MSDREAVAKQGQYFQDSDDHKTFDFTGTPFLQGRVGAGLNRLNWRAKLLLSQNVDAIAGKRVLDMACADGRFGFAALRLGAAHLTGVEGRAEEVERGQQWYARCGINPDQFNLIVGDAVDYLFECEPGKFDTILCFGFFYHTLRQIEILQEIARLRPQTLIMDTTVASERWYRRPGRFVRRFRRKHLLPHNALKLWRSIEGDEVMFFATEEASNPSATIIANLGAKADWMGRKTLGGRFKPTGPMVERLFTMHGFDYHLIDWHNAGICDWTDLEDYKRGSRLSYVAWL